MKSVRSKTQFICQICGMQSPRWVGRCTGCGQWNSLKEETVVEGGFRSQGPGSMEPFPPTPIDDVHVTDHMRVSTGMAELDRVLGGGVVPGSVILVGGDPGIGKTTLLLQTLHRLGKHNETLLYVSGEESPQQIKMRGDRLGVRNPQLYILSETSLEALLKGASRLKPAALVVDSIQTVFTEQLNSVPGSVSQVQEVTCQLMWYAKRNGVPVFIIGHVTKEGMIAGPKLLEHIVDTVLYFEGEKGQSYRILRAVKNRFGATNEIGVFEMKDAGLVEVTNPSELFLAGRPLQSTGSVVVSSLEGSRPILVELQALVTTTGYAMPKRMSNGVDLNRVSLLLAVMEKQLGFHLSGYDVYVNVVGGLHIDEPSIDLGIVAAVGSSLRDCPIDSRTLMLGEVGLGGEIRPVGRVEMSAKEAVKLGFTRCVLPERNLAKFNHIDDLEVIGVANVGEVIEQMVTRA